ncbi:hypothetical protein [Microbulbifer aggregans]|uniref:hypothetical protein n=1 Tax=Microbulbifer aggregans TaxID=1769779 RepID=UPI001CFE3E6D|nr:hypothetical protein [Microbulbifer aggregans]
METEIIDRLEQIQSTLNYLSVAIFIYISFSMIKKISQISINFHALWKSRWRDKAYNYFEKQKYTELLQHCESELESRPNLVMGVWWKARAHHELGNIESAIENYNRVLHLEPSYKAEYVAPYFDVSNQELKRS